jgi:hypothetical protein
MEPINWNELREDPAAIEASPLQRVIGVGAGRTVNGITIELLALELREFGAFATIRIEMPSQPERLAMVRTPEIVVRDDVGTRYAAMLYGGGGTYPGPGSMIWFRYQAAVVPAVALRAGKLTIRVGRIGNQLPYRIPTPEGSVDALSEPGWIEGPWKFEIPLGR